MTNYNIVDIKIKFKIICFGLISIFLCAAFLGFAPQTAIAMEEKTIENDDYIGYNENAEPCALYVKVVVSIDGANGEVWSIAQTTTAIFASSIYVTLELYSSDEYQDAYTNMTLEKRVSTNNLAKGESIKAVMPTNGAQKYWRGRMYYKADSGKWKYGETNTWLFDQNGIIVL